MKNKRMKLTTKSNIGDKVYVLSEQKNKVKIYKGEVRNISMRVFKDGEIYEYIEIDFEGTYKETRYLSGIYDFSKECQSAFFTKEDAEKRMVKRQKEIDDELKEEKQQEREYKKEQLKEEFEKLQKQAKKLNIKL